MKINPMQTQGVPAAYQRQEVNRPRQQEAKAAALPERPADAVELSPEAQEVAGLKQHLAEMSAVREQRVAELSRQVQGGAYQVPARDVARKILDFGL